MNRAIVKFIEQICAAHKIDIRFVADEENRYVEEIEVALYRIVTELINNTIKYAESSSIELGIFQDGENSLRLEYTDNGVGFDLNDVNYLL